MIALKIILLAVGVAFILFGCSIFFKKKYSLINGFERDFKSGRRTEEYARRVGLVEMIIGAVLLVAAIVLAVFT